MSPQKFGHNKVYFGPQTAKNRTGVSVHPLGGHHDTMDFATHSSCFDIIYLDGIIVHGSACLFGYATALYCCSSVDGLTVTNLPHVCTVA